MRKRMTSLLLTLVMLLSLVPAMGVTASAAASGNGTQGNPFVVTTYEDWKAAMQQSGETYIKLGADIDTSTLNSGYGLGSSEEVRVRASIHLDLNGKKLTLKKSMIDSGGKIHFINVIMGSLTIEDSQSGGEIFGVNKVTRRYMRLIDVIDGAKLTLNSGKLHLEVNADADSYNATIMSTGTVEINSGTVAISLPDGLNERGARVAYTDCALRSSGEAVINGGIFDGRVVLEAVAKAPGVADNVITGGDFKQSIYFQKEKAVTGNVPLNVSIQGGTYHYTPKYYTYTSGEDAGKKSSDPCYNFLFATIGFSEEQTKEYTYFPLEDGTWEDYTAEYDMNAFASMFPKNAIISATGQEYEYIDAWLKARTIKYEDAVYTGSSSALDLARLVNSHYKTVTVTTPLPIDSVTLNVPKLKEGAASGDSFTLSGTNTGVSTINTVWEGIPTTGAVAGNFYAARITLTAKDGYAFSTKTQVNLNGDYLSKGSGIENGGAGMTIYVNVPVRHEHTYGAWQIAGNGNVHFRKCSCGVQESKPHEWKYLEGQDKYKCTVCGYEIDGEKDRITYVYASPRSPIAGEHPGDYTPAEWVEIGGANYKVASIVWKNMDNTDVTTFEAGKIYKGTVTFKADTGFAFDGDRIYASKIFNSSNAEVVGNYTLTNGGTILTATFKLKDNTVRPGLKAKVKLPTLSDKVGQSLPAAELVDTTLPENVALVYSVYEDNLLGEAITDPNYKVKSNQRYVYVVWLKVGDSTDITEITKTHNVSYEVIDGGDAETCTDFVGYGVLAVYQTPDTSKINVSVRGKVVSYNPNNVTTIQLMQGGKKMYQTTIAAATGSGQKPQNFSFPAVAPGTYDLVVTKPGHLTYTVKNVKVESTDLDLTKRTGKLYSTITLLAGDVNRDGSITESDVSVIRLAANINKKTTVAGVNPLADVNGDGSVTESDVSVVRLAAHINKSAKNNCNFEF